MAFRDEQFPPQIAEGALGGPEFMTEVVTAGSGDEQRNRRWAAPRWHFNAATGMKDQSDAAALFAFILAVGVGQAYSFPFKDWSDYVGTGEIIGTGDGATTDFQITRTYTVGSYSFVRAIVLPITSTVKVYLDGVLQSSGYTLGTRGDTGGLVSFSVAPAAAVVVSADFEFDVCVRFASDLIQGNIFSATILLRFENIDLIEVRDLVGVD